MTPETQATFAVRDAATGAWVDVDFHVGEYQKAADRGLTLSQYLTQEHGAKTDETKFGSVVGQFMQSAGLFLGEDVATGLKAPTMKAITEGGALVGAITRNDGSERHSPSGRLLFAEIIMRTIESELRENQDDFLNGWDNLIAVTNTINGPKFDQPIINVKAPEDSASNPIGQLAEPDAMVSITTAEYTRNIPTKSIGLMISDQALQATTLDLVGLSVSAQARGERIRMVENQIKSIVNGDNDLGESALPTRTAQSIDASISAAGEITHTAWVKYLRTNYQKMSHTNIICDIDTALAIEARSGRPNVQTDFGNGNNFPVDFSIDNLAAEAPRVLLMDTAVIGANTVVGLDRRWAIRRVINVSANYSAIENFVLRRAQGMRFDYGEIAHRLYDDAFDVMTLTV